MSRFVKPKSDNAQKIYSQIEELHPYPVSGVVRLPELVGVPFTGRVRAIVDHPYFQRLRRVRQLSMAYLVYPGAMHTRFEHSLGVFETATKYLTALLTNGRSELFAENITIRDVESLMLAALIHDIGHYPFAHMLEDWVGEVVDHVEFIRQFLTGEISARYPALKLKDDVPSLWETIQQHWENASLDDICYFVSGQTGGSEYPAEIKSHKSMVRSILDGPIDADKMDYLYRDSMHCGVPYGKFIDRDRFFQSLTVDPDRPDTIAIHEKGRICMDLFGYARSAMFSEVYWHHSSRAISVMINRAFAEAVSGDSSIEKDHMMNELFRRSEEETVLWLAESGSEICSDIMRLVDERRLYKRLFVLRKHDRQKLFEALESVKWGDTLSFVKLQDSFIARLNEEGLYKYFSRKPLRKHDILIDVPRKRTGLPNVPVVQDKVEYLSIGKEPISVWNGIKSDFERWVRKIRVFCHPDLLTERFSRHDSQYIELKEKFGAILLEISENLNR